MKLEDGSVIHEKTLESFDLTHYAVMLIDFDLPIYKDRFLIDSVKDYNNYLPLDRMAPFVYNNFIVSSLRSQWEKTAGECTLYEFNFETELT